MKYLRDRKAIQEITVVVEGMVDDRNQLIIIFV